MLSGLDGKIIHSSTVKASHRHGGGEEDKGRDHE